MGLKKGIESEKHITYYNKQTDTSVETNKRAKEINLFKL